MPELTERKLLCRCGHDGKSHPNRGGKDEHCFRCAGTGEKGWWHPFDGIPYVPCPAGCENGARTNDHGLVTFKCFACEDSPVPGWVREEA